MDDLKAKMDALDAAATWLRECSGWLLSNDLDMTCPMETDPLDLADDLDAVVGHIIVAPVWRETVADAANLFEFYADEHKAKANIGPEKERAGRLEKAERNAEAGRSLRALLQSALPTPPKGE